MFRTTINLPFALHHQLQFLARGRRTTVSDVVRELVEKAVAAETAERLDHSYAALRAIKGSAIGKKENLSGQIDELLYGEHGAWKGQDE